MHLSFREVEKNVHLESMEQGYNTAINVMLTINIYCYVEKCLQDKIRWGKVGSAIHRV